MKGHCQTQVIDRRSLLDLGHRWKATIRLKSYMEGHCQMQVIGAGPLLSTEIVVDNITVHYQL